MEKELFNHKTCQNEFNQIQSFINKPQIYSSNSQNLKLIIISSFIPAPMSLPSSIADPVKTIPYNPGIVSTDPELAYTLSFASYPTSNDSVHFHPRDSYNSPLSQYQFADFDDSTYDHLLQQTTKNYRAKNVSVIKGIRSSFKEFYARLAALTHQSALKYNHLNAPKHQKLFEVSKLELDFRIEGIKGNIPAKWPEGLNEFQKEINALPWNAFSTESYLLLEDMTNQIKTVLSNSVKKLKTVAENDRVQLIDRLLQMCEVLVTLSLKTLNQSFVLQQILFVQKLLQQSQIHPREERLICDKLSETLKTYLRSIPKQHDQNVKYHCNQHLWDTNAFLLMKKIHFQKVAGLAYYSVTTDGKYLYIYVSAINGGMFKFGTGNNGTVAGKLYFEKQLNLPIGTKLEEVNWVYLKDKLYLKISTKDPSSLDVYSPEDFKKIGTVQLACKSLFGHTVLLNMNRNSILLTDGQHLYFLGKRIKITQSNILNKTKSEEKKEDPQQNDKNSKKQKKKKKKEQAQQANQPNPQQDASDQSVKFLEIVLAKFDVEGKLEEEDDSEAIDEESITQIFQSFSGYFTKEQCKRAYRLNHYDIMETCQWLFDEGNKEKEKSIKILPVQKTIVLCESQITSNFNEKTFKTTNEIVTKDGSLLHIFSVNESIWTMDTEEITCYSQSGVKTFSKKPLDDKKKSEKTPNQNLLAKRDNKYPRNPEYLMIHDPYNKLFYTFAWPSDGHYFPCPVLVSKDAKEEISLQIKRRSSVDTSASQKFSDIAKFFLTELSLLEINDDKNYQFNDHVWWYGQKINKLNTENNTANADDKKKISNKKAKVMAKLNKINEITKTYQKDVSDFTKKGKVIKQIIKLYPFSSDGSIESLSNILESFKNIENCPRNNLIGSFLVCVEKWLTNSSELGSEDLQKKISEVHQILVKIRNGPSTSETNKHEINRIIIRNFDVFYKNRDQAINFLVNLPIEEIQSFLNYFDLNSTKSPRESIIYEIAKKDLLIAKYDSKYNFPEIFKEKSDPREAKKNMIAFLLMRKDEEISAIHENLLTFIQNCIMSSESILITEFFNTLFTSSFKQINQLKSSQEKLQYLSHLFEDSFRVIEKCLSASSVSKTLSLIPSISFMVQVYYSSAIRLLGNQNIIKSLLKIIDLVQKPQLIEFYSCVKNQQFEGISAIQEKIYETCHPLERGKSQSFPSAHFPESSFLFLEFDKRCQSDQNHDIMTIQLLHEESAVGNSIPCHDGAFSTNLRLTGKIDMKKPALMLGNNVSVDFTSSGHAKDAQSFGRFGFKFGLRPISAGKIFYEKSADTFRIQKVFKSKENFRSYINTLKFLVVTVSATLQSLLSVEEGCSSEAVKNLLTGKIIRQGLEETKLTEQSNNAQSIVNQFLSKDYQDPEKDIMKKININLLVAQKQEKAQDNSVTSTEKDLWNAEGIPQYIKSYIEQIKNFKGDFIDVFKQARVHAPPQGTYLHELRRPGFTPELRQHWLQGEALLFLTVLKHSGLLHLNLKFSIEYIKENLKAFEQARNGIFFAFISRMQMVREWRDLVETYHSRRDEQAQKEPEVKEEQKPKEEKKELLIRKNNRVVRTVQFQKKEVPRANQSTKKPAEKQAKKSKEELEQQRIKNAQKEIRQRLSDQYRIQQLCNLKKIQFTANNIHQNVTRILEVIKKVNLNDPEYKASVYVGPIQHLIKGCLFLLACKSPSTRQSLDDDHDIEPMALGRSLSSDNRHVNHNKVQIFREWLENWKKWKGFKKENKVEFKFPVLEIVEFINSWADVEEVKQMIAHRTHTCQHRIEFYKSLNQLLKSTHQSLLLSKYVFGTEILHLTDGFKSSLQSAPLAKLDQLQTAYNQYASTIKDIQGKFVREQLSIEYKKFLSAIRSHESVAAGQKSSASQKDFLNRLRINAEIIYMIESENPFMSLDLALYFLNFKFLSNQNEQLIFLSSLITNRAFLIDHSLNEILDSLKKQVGNNNLAAKRWKDLLFIERVLFLLRKLEIIVRRRPLQSQEKQRIAQTLFYLLNLTDVPSISKIGLKVLKKLKDVNFKNLPTLLNYRYKSVKLTENSKAVSDQYLSLENIQKENNVELLSKKSLSIFKHNNFTPNPVQKRLLQLSCSQSKQLALVPKPSGQKQSYNIILNIHQEQDLAWFLRVMFYIEELERQSGKGSVAEIKDWKEYLENKQNKQNKKNEQQQQQQANNAAQVNAQLQSKSAKVGQVHKEELTQERILTFIPQKIAQIDPKLQDEMPVGWYMSYCNVFKDYNSQKVSPKSPKQSQKNKNKYQLPSTVSQPNPNKKAWQSTVFLKLSKKFEELNSKPLEQPKQTDTQQVKAEFVKAKNFILRIRKHLAEILLMINMFTNYGYVVFREDLTKEKALELCHLISLGAENKLKPIKVQWTKDDYKNRIAIEDAVNVQSKIKITLIQSENYSIFQDLISLESSIPLTADSPASAYVQINKKEHILQDATYHPFEDFLDIDSSSDSENKQTQFCKEFIQSRIFKMKKREEEVYLPDYPKLKYFISQGGIQTGLKNVTLVPASQHSLTLQSVPLEDVLTSVKPDSTKDHQPTTDTVQQIIQKITTLIKHKLQGNEAINTEQKIMDYLLVSFYLKKLSKFQLTPVNKDLLKTLATSLVKFGQGFKSFQPIQHYQSEMQKLLIKLIDHKQSNLRVFEIFNSGDYEISPTIANYIVKVETSQKAEDANKQIKQDITTHHFPKSSYLLKTQAPQVEENKLLKYWEKNILPKIHQFVKTTLRPLEIEDFFEQMRMPLRKNDQMQAKKIAYVICDNKLPQGAVLPDSNHNWNSLSLEDITIGQYALVKLPKHTLQSISPLLTTGHQQHRLVKIVFIDIKAPSILVRYRIDEYGIMGYAWVPINSLVRVEKEILHLSPQHLYTQIQKNIKGMIYGYSKLCLTQLTSVSDLDQSKLIKQTIADLFIHNPISGWLSPPATQWSMKHSLKTMLDKHDLHILDQLEKQFCPIQSFETDLFTDQVVKLNRFENAKALVVSFKKTSAISLTSGVKFYKDPYLFNEIMHVYTTKTEKTEFEPLVFNDPDVFCKYYTNKECLKPSQLHKYSPKPIQVTVFGVSEIWTIGCYLGEVISQMAEQQMKPNYLEILKRLNRLYLKWILDKKVAVLCSELAKLVSRITNRIIAIQQKLNLPTTPESLGIDEQLSKDLLAWIKTILQEEESTPLSLYSELLQNLSEMSAVIFRKILYFPKGQTLPVHIDAMISLLNVLIRINEHLKGQKIVQKPQPSGQWERLLLIEKIPDFVDRKDLIEKIKQIISNNKGKILTPKFDIFPKDDKLCVCVQGWNITELVEEEIVQKIQKEDQEEEKQQQEEQGMMMEWECLACTMLNPMGNSHCEVCGTEMPPPPAAKEVYEQVEATDVSKAENKLKQLQAKRFQAVKEEILQFFVTYWDEYCKKTQKKNKQLQQAAKNRIVMRKKDKQPKQDQKPLLIPEKPSIDLKTGSDILANPIIQSFLQHRWIHFRQNVKKLAQTEPSFLMKFKKLQNLGYDLWCDNIYHENPTLIPFERLYQLMNYIQGEICKGSSSVLSYSENSIRLLSTIPLLQEDDQPINYQVENNIGVKTKYKNLAELKSYNIRYSWKLVKELNVAASKCLQFINMNLKHNGEQTPTPKNSDCLGSRIKCFRNLIMGAIKLELTQKIIQKTSVLRQPQEMPKVYLERLRVTREDRGKDSRAVTLKQKDDFLFTKAHQQFAKVSSAMLRPFKPKGTDPYLSFSITFRGEMAMGEAGPYRQFFTDISNQLDPKNHMGLFIPTPNNKHNSGESRSKWTPNPKANSSYHLALYEFLGILMGCCIRTGTHLALDLPKMFWKLLVSQTVTQSDLEETDHRLLQTLHMIKDIPTRDMFQQLQQYSEPVTWTFTTSDGEQHELIHNGKAVKVNFQEREKYIAEVKRKRIHEAILQITRLKKGLQEMMPEAYFNCVTGDELKLMVCGRPKVDVDLLKKHTKYAGGLHEEQRRIKYFWQVMKEIEEADKLKVIKFCWGQQRLPINSQEFERNNIRFMIKPMMNEKKSDQSLPKADTCFFNIQLPNYSTKEVMKSKLLLAINMDCVSINADENFNPDDNPLMNEIEDDNMYNDEEGGEEW